MKRISILFFFLFSIVQLSFAQQDPKAAKILDAMSKKYQAMKAFRASFVQTLENPSAKIKENMEGDITVSGNKFRLKMSGQEVINNGATIWTYMKSENEVNISENDPDEQEMSPNRIYTMYKKGYKYVYLNDEKVDGELCSVIELSPEDKSNPIFKVRMLISKKDNSVKSWKMFKNNGNRYTFTIKEFTPNVPVDGNTFAFDKTKYKGVKVIDLR
ncbi:LolA family protein [Adhaeribacter soli]|uniref:Outer membrane lipoprotein carrier protein LolA n=1 Tax=Adhaeribacter soli TaxID=2607655 RepID=A0A5N1J7B2_9BACT|nr:outer membrane lipoprotein carrier protein LolA [Adhaeribacter soli]KAA9340601.1 outer membrane lipoprotein carrier protein LolA [Adhaeribacter soli]